MHDHICLFTLQLSLEKEEQERQELRKMIMEGDQEQRKGKDKKKDDDDNQSLTGFTSQPGKSLYLCTVKIISWKPRAFNQECCLQFCNYCIFMA